MPQIYHTDLIIRYQLGLLPQSRISTLPRSTRHNWKSRDLTRLIGLEEDLLAAENIQIMKKFLSRKRWMQAAKAVWHIYGLFSTLFENLNKQQQLFRQNSKKNHLHLATHHSGPWL